MNIGIVQVYASVFGWWEKTWFNKKLYKTLWPFKDLIKFCITQEMTRQTFLCFLPKLGIKNSEDGME